MTTKYEIQQKKYYKVSEVSEILQISKQSVRNYVKDGRLNATRTKSNHRLVSSEELIRYLSEHNLLEDDKFEVLYQVIDSNDNIRQLLEESLPILLRHNVHNVKIIHTNKGNIDLDKLLDLICNSKVTMLFIKKLSIFPKDTIPLITKLCNEHDVKIIEDDQNDENTRHI